MTSTKTCTLKMPGREIFFFETAPPKIVMPVVSYKPKTINLDTLEIGMFKECLQNSKNYNLQNLAKKPISTKTL